ncbi:serine/threonine protein kinase, partial [Streptomyces sp. NPDC048845]
APRPPGGRGCRTTGPGAAPASGAPAQPRPGAAARAAAEERLRSALRAVRDAAAARRASTGAAAGAGTAAGARGGSGTSGPAGARRGVTASLTDVVPRRTLAVIAAVVVLAVLAVVLVFTLGDGDGSGGGSAAKDSGTTAGKDGAADGGSAADRPAEPKSDDGAGKPDRDSADGKEDAGGQDGRSGSDGGDSAGDAGKEASDEVPDGYAEKTDDRFHFSMALPEGWKRTGIAGQNSGGIYSESGGFPRVQIDFNSSPTNDAAAAWRGLEDAVRGSMPGYKSLGISSVDYRGYPTVADWSFERDQGGERVRVLNRGFKVDARHGYSIMITCVKDAWDEKECRTLRETAFATFRPRS